MWKTFEQLKYFTNDLAIVTAKYKKYEEEDDKRWESEPERKGVKVPSADRVLHHWVSVHGPTKYPSKAKHPPDHDDHQEDQEDIIDKVCVDIAVSLERFFG